MLKNHKKQKHEKKLLLEPNYSDYDLVFCQDKGLPLHPDTISSWFPAFLKRAGLPRLNFHCLRHTHASLLLKAGVDIKIISERLGHSSVRITYDIYSHLMPGMQRTAVEKLEQLLK
ncbi:MAG: site-specific integrase [Firmicutes bacterium]|nr:site-specific integrase [Bacillota bacterium]